MPDFKDSFDSLNMATALRRGVITRTFFDPSRESHLESLRCFVRTGNWGNIQFYCEAPYTDVPMTVLMKYASYEEGVQRESGAERQARLKSREVITPDEAAID